MRNPAAERIYARYMKQEEELKERARETGRSSWDDWYALRLRTQRAQKRVGSSLEDFESQPDRQPDAASEPQPAQGFDMNRFIRSEARAAGGVSITVNLPLPAATDQQRAGS
jgi:hypothetical protein